MADRRLQVFHAVAKYGSFTRAAAHLFMTQPAVTFQIKQLEEEFDTRLLDRGHGQVSLTTAGKVVFAYAEKILDLTRELETRVAELTGTLTGALNLGASTTIAMHWLPEILGKFKRLYPGVTPRVKMANSQHIVEQVASKELDIGLIEVITDHPALERFSAGVDELFVICSPDHPLAKSNRLKAEDLTHYPFINRDPGNAIHDLAEIFFNKAGISLETLHTCAELGTSKTVFHLAIEGFSFAFASGTDIEQEKCENRLVAIALDPPLYTPLEVIFPRDKFRSLLISTFAEFASKELAHKTALTTSINAATSQNRRSSNHRETSSV